MVERDEGTMDNQINQTVERIGQLPDGEHPVYGLDYDNVPIEYLGTKDEIKALASAYTKAVSDLAKAKAGLEHYADSHLNWVYSCQIGHSHNADCLENKYVAADSSTGQHGYTVAQQTLDEILGVGKE